MSDLSQYSDAQLMSMLQQVPPPTPAAPQVADLTNASNIPQAEVGYVLNSANYVPGLNLIKEAGAGLRGLYAGATAPSDQNFGQAYSDEYDKSRANQNALMAETAKDYPGATAMGHVGGALASMGVLPTPASTSSLVGDAALGGTANAGYGFLGGLGNGSSMDERAKNALTGAKYGFALGAPMSAVAGGLGQAATGFKNLINPQEEPAIQAALTNNIPLYKNNISNSKALDYLSTLSNEVPSVLGGTSGRVPGQQQAIAEALTKPINESSGVLNSDVVSKALSTSGKQIQEIAGRNDVPYDSDLDRGLQNVLKSSKGTMSNENYGMLQNKIDSLQEQSTDNIIPGQQYKDFRTSINQEIQDNARGPTATYGNALRNVRNVVDQHAIANMSPDDALAMQKARGIYSNAKDLETVTDKSPTGNYTFGSLYGKLGDNPNFQGPALAAQLLKGETGNSGTAQREFIIDTMKGLGAAGMGTAGIYGANREFGNKGDALEKTLMEVGSAGLGAASVGAANRLVNPQITNSNLYGIPFLRPVSAQAQQFADLLNRSAPAATQIYRGQ